MNWKPTWVLLTATAVVFAFIVLVEYPIRQERLRQASHVILPGLDPAAVTNIEIQPWGRPAIHAETSGRTTNRAWRLTQPISYPARSDRVEALLDSLAKLEWGDPPISDQELKDRPGAQEQFGFIQPRFSILLEGGVTDRRLEVGDLSPMGDEVFLSLVGGTAIYLAGAELLQFIPQDKDDWRDPSLLNLEKIPFDELRVRSAAKEMDLRRDSANHLWFMNHPWQARADSGKINYLLDQMSRLAVSKFVSDDPQADLEAFGLQPSPQTPDLTLVFSRGTNRTASLQIGASLTNQPALVYSRRPELGGIVLVEREPFRLWQRDYTNFLDQHLISGSPSWIDSIEVHGEDNFSVRKETNGQWRVHARENFPADTALMEFWVESLTNIQTAIEKTVVADFSEYGLVHPALRYLIHFHPDAGSNAPAQIEIGTNKNGRVFERRTDEEFVNSIGRDDFGRLPQVSWQLRDRRVWNFDSSNVVSLTVHQLGGTRKYLRDPDGGWTLAPGYKGPPFPNSDKLEEGVHEIGKLIAVYWDGIGEDSLERFGFAQADFNLEFEIRGPKGVETLRVEFGARSPYLHPYASVVRDGRRLIFEFPADLYENFVEHDLTIPAALRYHP
jgi:hypothetical protein